MSIKALVDSLARRIQALFSSIRVRLLLVFDGLLILALLLGGLTTVYFIYQSEVTAWRGRQGEAVLNASDTVVAFTRQVADSLYWVSFLNRDTLASDPQLLRDLLYQNTALLEVVRMDAGGRIAAAASLDKPVLASTEANPELRGLLGSLVSSQPYLGIFRGTRDDEPAWIMAVRVPAGGAVIARLRMDVLGQVVGNVRFGRSGRAYVIDRTGQVIAHTDQKLALERSTLQGRPELIALLDAPGQEWYGEYTNFEGDRVVGASATVPGADWIAIAEISVDEAYATTWASFSLLSGMTLALGLLFMGLSRQLLERSVFGPIQQLKAGVELIGRGDLDYRIEIGRRDEIGAVAEAFNEMALRLQARDRQIAAKTTALAGEIAERQKAEVALRESEKWYRAVVEDQTELICRFLPDGTLSFVNQAFCRYYDVHYEDAVGLSLFDWIPEIEREHLQRRLRALDRQKPIATLEYRQDAPNGQAQWQQWTFRAILDERDRLEGYQAVGRDVTERKQTEDQLVHDALHDALTGLPNRVLLMDRLTRLIEHARHHPLVGFAVLFVDLDRFKVVNDSLGHMLGDQLLVAMARRLESALRPEDTVARLGGDEFAILLADLNGVGDSTRVADRILQRLVDPFQLGDHQVYSSASIGIAYADEQTIRSYDRAEDIVRDADTAMYRAKLRGKGHYQIFDEEMHSEVVRMVQLEVDLRRAIERQEFVLYFQPILSLAQQRVVRLEALLRWNHPERGIVTPAEFIPFAEECGLMDDIGAWVLTSACHQARAWQMAGQPHVGVCVNVSPTQFENPNLVAQIRQVLHETGLSPQALELEITEGVALKDIDRVTLRLEELKRLGVHLSIDDFGTGYSSLSRLKRFPIHTLKIDRLFVEHVTTDTEDAALAAAIITLGHNLNLELVAEGVETKEQLQFFAAHACDHIQGFLLSRPMPLETLNLGLRQEERQATAAERLDMPACRPLATTLLPLGSN